MTIQTNVPQDVRRRADEMPREMIATTGGNVAEVRADIPVIDVGTSLLQLLERSAQSLRHAAENVENRGLKVLLKVVAQERVAMYNSLRQAMGQGVANPLDSSQKSSGTRLQEGLQDIQTSMTVQRQGRENVALNHLLEEEDALLAAYTAVMQGNKAAPLRALLEAQRSIVNGFYTRLQRVGDGHEPIVARVFDTRVEGESAIVRLKEQGLDASQIDATTITRVARPVVNSSAEPTSPRNTMIAGALGGAVIGGIVGGTLALYTSSNPQFVGWVTVGPWVMLMVPMLIGALFGTVFGFFIGQNRREDDVAVTMDSLINGEVLVVAYPQPHQVDMAEDVLQIHHARELNR